MARQTKGRIFKAGKKGAYHLQYYVNGKEFKCTLRDDAGNIITTEREAIVKAEAEMAWAKQKTLAEKLKKAVEAADSAEAKAARMEEEQKKEALRLAKEREDAKATLATGWDMFMASEGRPESCQRYTMDSMPQHCTMKNYYAYYRKFVEWMEKRNSKENRLSAISKADAVAFMNHIQTSGATGTFNKYLQFFKLFFDILIKEQKITIANPFENIKSKKIRYNSKDALEKDEIQKLIDSANGEMKLLIAIGYFTGLRFGDCCTLLWSEIDMERRIIERIPRKTEHTIKDFQEAIVKIGIPNYLFYMLDEIAPEQRTGYVLPEYAKEYLEGKEYRANRRLLDHFEKCGIKTIREGTGTPEIRNDDGKIIKKAVRAVIQYGFHSLRYSYISHNAEAGTPATIIQKNAGHANPAMTEHYTRISDSACLTYANKLSLPLEDPDVINVEVITDGEPERQRMKELADSLPLDKIKEILKFAKDI